MTRMELPLQVASIKQAVSSAITCSSTTVEDLKLLLTSVQEKKAEVGKTTKATNENTVPIIRPVKKSTKKPTVAVVEIHEDVGVCLQPLERFRLATEIVNATLKGLTEAIKAPPLQKPNRPRKSLRRSSSSQSSGSPNLLRPQCVNLPPQATTSKGRCPRRSSSAISDGQTPGVLALAECSRLAFATLRKLNISGDPKFQMPQLQLETGMSALISKMIALGLDDLATRELRILTRRLSSANNTTQSKGHAKRSNSDILPAEKQTLVDLLHLDTAMIHGELLSLTIASQLQVLKLISSRKRPSIIEAAFEHLRLSTPYSPANTILQSVTENNPGSREKAARQLEILSQTLFSLCPSASSGEDAIAGDSRKSVPPHVVLNYQLLALEIRVKWWEVSGHHGDIIAEMASPFAKYLRAFSRRSLLTVSEKYAKAKVAYTDFSGLIQADNTIPHPLQASEISPYLEINHILANLARDSPHPDEAMQWMIKSLAHMKDHGMSPTRICDTLCQISALEIQAELEGRGRDDPSVTLDETIQALKGDLKGDSAELDELLISIARLRKVTFLAINKHSRHATDGILGLSQNALLKYIDVISLNVTFLVRYIGSRPKCDPSSRSSLRYQQRRVLVDKVFKPSIESITALARLPVSDHDEVWERVDQALQDCARLSSLLEADLPSEEASIYNKNFGESPFLVLSNAYWCRYLKRKQSSAGPAELRCNLQKSIRLISERPPFEKNTGFLPVKLEKLGALYESSGEPTKALTTYTGALETLIGNNCLREAVEDAATRPLFQIFGKDGKYSVFGRILSAYSRVAFKGDSNKRSIKPLFDDTTIPPAERGLLFEEQLRMLMSTLQTNASLIQTQPTLREVSRSLLAIYNKEQYPIRRLRTIVTLLWFHSANPLVLSPDTVQQLLQKHELDVSETAGADVGLQRFAAHLKASLEVCFTMLQPPFAGHCIQPALEAWYDLVVDSPNLESIQDRVGDVPDWLNQLRSLVEYLGMQGCEVQQASTLRILTTVQGLQDSTAPSELVQNLSEYSTQILNLGYSGEAGVSLQKAKRYMDTIVIPRYAGIRWHLASARYFLEIGSTPKCKEHVASAESLLTLEKSNDSSKNKSYNERYQLITSTAETASLLSLLAFSRCQPAQALLYARQSVKLTYRAWALLEHQSRSTPNLQYVKGLANEGDTLSDSMTVMTISEPTPLSVFSTKHESLKCAAFWPLVPCLFQRLLHLSQLFAYQGLLPEAQYYAEQAQKICCAVTSDSLEARFHALKGTYEAKGARPGDGIVHLEKAKDILVPHQPTLFSATIELRLAQAYALHLQNAKADSSFNLAMQVLEWLASTPSMSLLVYKAKQEQLLASQMQGLTIKDTISTSKPAQRKRIPIVKCTTNMVPEVLCSSNFQRKSQGADHVPLERFRGELLRQQAISILPRKKTDSVARLLLEAATLPSSQQDSVVQALAEAKMYLRQGLEEIVSDPVLCVLNESTISCPSTVIGGRRQSKESVEPIPETSTRATKSKRQPAKLPPKAVVKQPMLACHEFSAFLCKALDILKTIHTSAQVAFSSQMIHTVSDVYGKTLMMLSAACSSVSKTSMNPTFAVYAIELGRSISILKESSAIRAEKTLSAQQDSALSASGVFSEDAASLLVDSAFDVKSFQADYIDIIPSCWSVTSISLSENRDELHLSKLHSGQTPFVVTIPLNRQNSRDADEEVFGFEQGKSELSDILDLADYSTHSAQDMSRKGAKTEWWEARAALDARLKDLLVNIENIWLGGFRGLFNQASTRNDLLSRFQQSFYNILNKHLPSRQKSGKTTKASRVNLDPRVLELFVGLRNPNELDELDEPLLDLLYFVIDILQFHGERNAYDEIDFDSIAIETLDALRHYHEAASDSQQTGETNHTILILDKALHCFPWESLPCMNGHPISRLPSLVCLRRRILQMRQQQSPYPEEGIYINPTNTSYILNPSNDLPSTQSTFLPALSSLATLSPSTPSQPSNILARPPTESEFASILSTRSLLLYFGHGSGGQYIRSRTIRELDHCAVALLMGCSSAKLKEEGSYEPHGVVKSYLMAGAPAVVGCLWDVTDRDVDRWGVECLTQWGLFEEEAHEKLEPVREKKKNDPKAPKARGKSRIREARAEPSDQSRSGRGRISLDQAVALGREKCYFRYLNGAAPVVYGVPVFLEPQRE